MTNSCPIIPLPAPPTASSRNSPSLDVFRVLFFGDIVGRPGRQALRQLAPLLRERYHAHVVIANADNAAGGAGLTRATVRELLEGGIDVLTGGNHTWDKPQGIGAIGENPRVLRPANTPGDDVPGRGWAVYETTGQQLAVVSLQGRIFMTPLDCPFREADRILEAIPNSTRMILVDFHAEATAEKVAMARYLDGRVSALIGTHTHVQTADDEVLAEGTAYLTDAGMTGPHDSVIGVRNELALRRMLTGLPTRFRTAEGDVRVHGVIIEVDVATGRARSITRVAERVDLASGTNEDLMRRME